MVCADPHEHSGGQLLTLGLLMLRKLGFFPDVKHSYVPPVSICSGLHVTPGSTRSVVQILALSCSGDYSGRNPSSCQQQLPC